jgi:acetyl-CoA synthetase
MPMIPEAAYAMLACARIGAVHSVVFGGFSPEASPAASRIATPSVVITADEGLRGGKKVPLKANVDAALALCPCVNRARRPPHRRRVMNRRPRCLVSRDAAHGRFRRLPAGADERRRPAVHPLHLRLHRQAQGRAAHHRRLSRLGGDDPRNTSSTTDPGDIYWCTADVGWVTGHSYIVYGPLANGATTLMFEGVPNYPDAQPLLGSRRQAQGQHLLHRPHRHPRADARGRRAGEDAPAASRCACSARRRADQPGSLGVVPPRRRRRRCPIVDTWWQTETGGILITPLPGATT